MPFVEYPQRAIGLTIRKRLGKPNQFGWIVPGWSEFGDDNIFTGVYQQRRPRKGNGINSSITFGSQKNFIQRPAWPSQPPSVARTINQQKFSLALKAWQNLTEDQISVYTAKANRLTKRAYDYFMSKFLKNDLDVYFKNDVPVEGDILYKCIASSQDGSFIVVGTQDNGLWISRDFGVTWTNKEPSEASGDFWQCVDCSYTGQNIIAGVRNGRLYYSNDYGETWSEVQPAGDFDKNWWSVKISSNNGYCFVAVNGGRLYKSGANAISWSEVRPAGDTNQDWRGIAFNSTFTTFWAVVYFGRIYVSFDSGATWSEKRPKGDISTDWVNVVCSANSQDVWVSRWTTDLYYSSNGGDTWEKLYIGEPPAGSSFYIANLSYHSNENLLTLSDLHTGIWISKNNGQSWRNIAPPVDSPTWFYPCVSINQFITSIFCDQYGSMYFFKS